MSQKSGTLKRITELIDNLHYQHPKYNKAELLKHHDGRVRTASSSSSTTSILSIHSYSAPRPPNRVMKPLIVGDNDDVPYPHSREDKRITLNNMKLGDINKNATHLQSVDDDIDDLETPPIANQSPHSLVRYLLTDSETTENEDNGAHPSPSSASASSIDSALFRPVVSLSSTVQGDASNPPSVKSENQDEYWTSLTSLDGEMKHLHHPHLMDDSTFSFKNNDFERSSSMPQVAVLSSIERGDGEKIPSDNLAVSFSGGNGTSDHKYPRRRRRRHRRRCSLPAPPRAIIQRLPVSDHFAKLPHSSLVPLAQICADVHEFMYTHLNNRTLNLDLVWAEAPVHLNEKMFWLLLHETWAPSVVITPPSPEQDTYPALYKHHKPADPPAEVDSRKDIIDYEVSSAESAKDQVWRYRRRDSEKIGTNYLMYSHSTSSATSSASSIDADEVDLSTFRERLRNQPPQVATSPYGSVMVNSLGTPNLSSSEPMAWHPVQSPPARSLHPTKRSDDIPFVTSRNGGDDSRLHRHRVAYTFSRDCGSDTSSPLVSSNGRGRISEVSSPPHFLSSPSSLDHKNVDRRTVETDSYQLSESCWRAEGCGVQMRLGLYYQALKEADAVALICERTKGYRSFANHDT
eukprot:GHVH01017406.1.p1 GENE.GHVH01017406.1~~GHVH01017406.1.p1  ORF type:complete len:631 (+),score=83.61 GHVH01017406.1:75-1967(+)